METTLAPVKSRSNERVALLVREMKRRKKMCEMKLKKLQNRIKVLDAFQNLPPNKKMSLSEFLKSRNLRMSDIFSPMGYYCPMNMVVSSDKENNYLTYHKGFESNAYAGFPTPKREIVANKEHREVMSSFYGMTWNPALNRYFPTTPFDADTYANADGDADLGMDIMGGFSMQDLANLNNKNSDARKLTKEVRNYVIEEYDNVEGEYENINEALNKIYYGDNYSSADGDSSNKEKRGKRKTARKEFRRDKRACKDKRNRGEITNLEFVRCIEKEKEEKKQVIDENAGFGRKAVRFATRFTPITALGRGGALLMIGWNSFGYATRLAPALLPDAEARNLFKPESIEKAKKGWIKTQRAWKNLGGKPEKLKEAILKGYKKKPKKSQEIKNTENVEEISSAEGVSTAVLVTAGTTVLTSLIGLVGKIVDKNPYQDGKTPADFQQGLNDGSVENPPLDPNAPALNEKGDWIDPKTGEKINPQTGKLDDRIFGINKYLALGIGIAGVVALYYLFKRK